MYNQKDEILTFIKSKKHAVISTCLHDQPESALIGFGETDSLEMIFGTYKTSRKYKNIAKNNKVALVIGWDEDYVTVQYEGIAKELVGSDIEYYVSLYHRKVPGAAVYKSHPEQTYFKIIPTWIRYSDLNNDPGNIFELNVFT